MHSLIWLIVIGIFWITLAPKQIGGRYTYIIVSGNSMEPFLKNGDLAILHPSEAYQIGEVILYRHPEIGSVIHRIIAIEGDRYTIQGDHNEWIDSYKPARSEIDGKLWFHLAFAGKIIKGFRTPVGAALLAGLLGILLFWPDRESQKKRETSSLACRLRNR